MYIYIHIIYSTYYFTLQSKNATYRVIYVKLQISCNLKRIFTASVSRYVNQLLHTHKKPNTGLLHCVCTICCIHMRHLFWICFWFPTKCFLIVQFCENCSVFILIVFNSSSDKRLLMMQKNAHQIYEIKFEVNYNIFVLSFDKKIINVNSVKILLFNKNYIFLMMLYLQMFAHI